MSTGTVALTDDKLGQAELMRPRPARLPAPNSGFTGVRFPPDVIMVAVRWYLRYELSYRDVEELLAEQGITSTPSLTSSTTVHDRHSTARNRPKSSTNS
jgi:transposase-like protein